MHTNFVSFMVEDLAFNVKRFASEGAWLASPARNALL
jgi:hypothetical protein